MSGQFWWCDESSCTEEEQLSLFLNRGWSQAKAPKFNDFAGFLASGSFAFSDEGLGFFEASDGLFNPLF